MPEPGQEETVRIVALDRSFHIGCYKCEVGGPGQRCGWGGGLLGPGALGVVKHDGEGSQGLGPDGKLLLFSEQECGLLLSSEGECQGCYPLDGHILCKACSAWRIQELSATVTTDC